MPEAISAYRVLTARPGFAGTKEAALATAQAIETVKAIMNATCLHQRIAHADFIGGARTKKVCEARMIAMLLIRRETNLTISEIGRLFGRDSTAVNNAMNRGLGLDTTDEVYRRKARDIDSIYRKG